MNNDRIELINVLKQKAAEPYYPLVPRLKYTAHEKYLLLWHTHNEQHQIFIANSIQQATQMWFAAQKLEGLEASAKELWKAKIVLPPNWVAEKYNKQRYDNDFYTFKYSFKFQIDQYVKRHKKLPPGVVRCGKQEHDSCECANTEYIILNSWDSLFRKDWSPPTYPKNNEPFNGLAADDAPLFVCELNGGHHNTGITLTPVNEDTEIGTNVLFFFHGHRLHMPEEITQSIEILKEKKKQEEIEAKRKYEERRRKTSREEDEWLINLLTR